jgi:glucose/arabinose dehydrogenase
MMSPGSNRPVALVLCSTVLAAGLLVGCGSQAEQVEGLIVAEGFAVTVAYEEIPGPTQVAYVADEVVVVGAINGGENDGQGQVWRIDLDTGEVAVVRDQLDKPTGVAVVDDELWVMERQRLSRAPFTADAATTTATSTATGPTVVLDDLPNNGRSQGTLTVTPDGLILFDTSGSKRGAQVTAGSGRLFTVDPDAGAATLDAVEVASGFKHAYAHVVADDGAIFTTEMSDGTFDGARAADELVAVEVGADHGWPYCVGDNRPVEEFGGSADRCAEVPGSVAVFAPGATPTSVAWSPFAERQLLVALWVEGRVVSIDLDADRPVEPVEVISGLAGPQHLLPMGDTVLITEFGSGRLLRLRSS